MRQRQHMRLARSLYRRAARAGGGRGAWLGRGILAATLLVALGACSPADSPQNQPGSCADGGGCLDAAAGGGDGGSVYGDKKSGALRWHEAGATVFDAQSGLLWQREVDSTRRPWAAAVSYCEALELGGYDDWKLPHRDELESIVLNLTTAPAIDTTAFPDTPAKPFWTRTLWAPDAENEAYGVDFNDGGTGHAVKTETHYARCTRRPDVR